MRHARALVARTKRNSVSIRVGASARRGFQEKIRGLRDRAKLDTGTTELGSARATLEGYCIGGKRDDCGGGHQYQRKGSVWRRWGTNRDTAPTKHARPVVNEPLLNTPCARHAVFIGYTTPKGTGSGGKGTGSVGTEFWMGFVAAVGNPSRRNHRDGHAPAAVGAEARRVKRTLAARTVGRDSTAARAVGVGEWRGHVRRIVRSLFWWHCVWRLRSQR